MRKEDIKKIVLNHLVEEQLALFPEEELKNVNMRKNYLELKKYEFQESECSTRAGNKRKRDSYRIYIKKIELQNVKDMEVLWLMLDLLLM